MRPRFIILTPPPSLMSGTDRFGPRTVAGLRAEGIRCEHRLLWPDAPARWMCRLLPYHPRTALYRELVARPALSRVTRALRHGDVVWLLETALPRDRRLAFERGLALRGVRLACHVQDNWFDLPGLHGRMAAAMVDAAELITVPTASLAERVRRTAPSKTVVVLEEPVDTQRFAAVVPVQPPRIVWAGNIANLGELQAMRDILAEAYRRSPFTLRVLSGRRRRQIDMPVPCEMIPYDPATEAGYLSGAVAGLAPLQDSDFACCKGAYKVKVYMAAGVPPVASPVGYQRELVHGDETGLLPDSPDAWVEAIVSLVAAPERARKLGAAARAAAGARFDHNAVLPHWADVFRNHFPEVGGAVNTED